jgi:hypothetical protein
VDADIPTHQVATTTTDATGQFTFMDMSLVDDQLQYLADAGHILDLTVEATAGGEYYSYSVSRYLSRLVEAEGGTPAPPVVIDTEPIALVPAGPSEGPTEPGDPTTEPGGAPPVCTWKKAATLGPRWVGLGSGYTTNSTTMTFSYKAGSTTALGVGMSVGGAGFKASGTTTVSSGVAIGFPSAIGVTGKVWRSQFVFARYTSKCHSVNRVQVRAVSFAGGANIQTVTTPPTATFCVIQPTGSTFVLDQSRATSFTAAVSGDIGISLSATTGYNNSTSITYSFAVGKRLCGKNGYPGASPGILVAKI